MITALHSLVLPGHEADYEKTHARIPADLVASFERVGIRDWTIWRVDRHLFHLVDCDDLPAALDQLTDDPANQAWQERIGVHVEVFDPADSSGNPAPLHQVWQLAAQSADASAEPR
jgi:L-rhamnose mutarotase